MVQVSATMLLIFAVSVAEASLRSERFTSFRSWPPGRQVFLTPSVWVLEA